MHVGYCIGDSEVPKNYTSGELATLHLTSNGTANFSAILRLAIVDECIIGPSNVNTASWYI